MASGLEKQDSTPPESQTIAISLISFAGLMSSILSVYQGWVELNKPSFIAILFVTIILSLNGLTKYIGYLFEASKKIELKDWILILLSTTSLSILIADKIYSSKKPEDTKYSIENAVADGNGTEQWNSYKHFVDERSTKNNSLYNTFGFENTIKPTLSAAKDGEKAYVLTFIYTALAQKMHNERHGINKDTLTVGDALKLQRNCRTELLKKYKMQDHPAIDGVMADIAEKYLGNNDTELDDYKKYILADIFWAASQACWSEARNPTSFKNDDILPNIDQVVNKLRFRVIDRRPMKEESKAADSSNNEKDLKSVK